MKILIDTRDPRLSPTERLAISNLANRLRPADHYRPIPPGHRESVDECLGPRERKQ
jgi:hypothetical protein